MAVLQSLISPWKRKVKKSYYNTGYSYLVTHPSTNVTKSLEFISFVSVVSVSNYFLVAFTSVCFCLVLFLSFLDLLSSTACSLISFRLFLVFASEYCVFRLPHILFDYLWLLAQIQIHFCSLIPLCSSFLSL